MKRIIKDFFLKLISYFGYTLSKKDYNYPIDLRKTTNNPRAFKYYNFTTRQIIIDVSFEKGRGLEIYSLSSSSAHPYIRSIKDALQSDDYRTSLIDKMSMYYSMVQPQNASEWLGFNRGEVSMLDNEPAWLSVLPWESSSLIQKKKERKDCAIEDNSEHGAKLGIEEGWRNFGPVSEEVLNLEVNRLYSLMVSIKENGVLRNDEHGGDIGAIVLLKDDHDFRWLVEWGGQHRAAAISAMGHKNVSVRVWQVVERKDVSLWPNVVSGIYSEEMALKLFDRIYDGVSRSNITKDWEDEG